MPCQADEDAAKLFVLGYVDAEQLSAGDQAAARVRMSEYAIQNRLQLGGVYIDGPNTRGAKFLALMASIEQFNPAYVLVPGLDHLAGHARPGEETKLQRIERRSGATAVVVEQHH